MAKTRNGDLILEDNQKLIKGSKTIINAQNRASVNSIILDASPSIEVNTFSSDTILSGDSDNTISTQKAVKTYTDALESVTSSLAQRTYADILQSSKYLYCSFDDFKNQSLVDTVVSNMTWSRLNRKYTFTEGQVLESLNLFDALSGLNEVTEAYVEVQYSDTDSTSTIEITADGTNWEVVTLGEVHTFANTGTTLQLRFVGAGVGEITSWAVFYGVDPNALTGLTLPLSASYGGTGTDTSAMNGLSKMTSGVVSVAIAGTDYEYARSTTSYSSTGSIDADALKNGHLNNYGQLTDAVLTFPAAEANMSAIFEIVDTSNYLHFAPPSGTSFLFVDSTGTITVMAADEKIVIAQVDMAVGEELKITTYQTGASTYGYKVVQTIGDGAAQESP